MALNYGLDQLQVFGQIIAFHSGYQTGGPSGELPGRVRAREIRANAEWHSRYSAGAKRSDSRANRGQWIWYIGIDLNAAVSIPRSPRIACTHLGVRPMPLQLSSGFCGLRYLAGLFWRRAPLPLADPSSGKMSPSF